MTEITSKPDYGAKITEENGQLSFSFQLFFDEVEEKINTGEIAGVFTVATLPDVGGAMRWIEVSDEVGGPTPAYNDGANWLRPDRTIVS